MNKIEVRHSSIIINDYTLGDSPNLEKFFSVFDKVRHTYFPKARCYDQEHRKLYLPRGIDIYYLESIFKTKAYLNTKCDPYRRLSPIKITKLPRDDVQKEAIRFVLGKDEYSYTSAKSQLAVNLNPGLGKTYLSIVKVACELILPMMITSNMGWIEQWKNRIMEFTDIKKEEIYIISGTGSIARILNGMNDPSQYKFILASHDTLNSYGAKRGWDKVRELFILLGVGIKIYDEAHLNFDNICMIDFFTNVMQTLYLTATPARSDERENIIYQMSYKNVPAIDLFNEDKDPRTQYIAINYNSHPTPFEVNNCKNAYGFDRTGYTNYIIHQPEFYKLIYILMEISKKQVGDGKTLIYIGTTEALNIVYYWMDYHFWEYRGQIGIYHSKIPKDIKDSQLDKKIILSTTKSCGAAIDIDNLMLTVVLAEPFKSEVLARQTLGRTRSRNTFYIEAVDRGFHAIQNYYKIKQPVFYKYATECKDVYLTDSDLDTKFQEIVYKKQLEQQQYLEQVQQNMPCSRRVVSRRVVSRVPIKQN